jgi:RecG-like helicase
MIWAVTEIRAIRDVSSDADDPVAQGVLLAHDMGLGKTLTASVAVWVDHVLDRKGGTSLFILPPAVVNQWYRQLKQLRLYILM